MDILDRAIATPLALLQKFASNEWVQEKGLDRHVSGLLSRAAGPGFEAAQTIGRSFAPVMARLRPARLEGPIRPKVFDLGLSDEQDLIRQTMRRFAEESLLPAAEAADEESTPPPELLEMANELGAAMLAIPEELGGAATERSSVTQALILEELARGDMGLAFAALAPLGVAHALVDHGSAAQQSKYLAAFAEESFLPAAFALIEPKPLFDPSRLSTRAHPRGAGYALHGTKSMVPLAATAELFLVAADLPGRGPALFLVERNAPGLRIEMEPTMGLRAAGLGRLVLDGVEIPRDAILGGEGDAFAREAVDYQGLVDRARIAWGAMAVGCSQAVLEYVIEYAKERTAFGEPIAHRQAVAFPIADMAVEIESMRLLVQRAASRADHGLPFHREAYLARILCAEKSMKIGTDGVQLLGGHGFIKDHPVERWYRHLRAVGVMEGGLLV